MSDMWGYNRLS